MGITPPRIPVSAGRKSLKEEGFTQGPSGGSAGELWLNKHGHPVFISYYGPDPSNFSTKSLHEALALKEAKVK